MLFSLREFLLGVTILGKPIPASGLCLRVFASGFPWLPISLQHISRMPGDGSSAGINCHSSTD